MTQKIWCHIFDFKTLTFAFKRQQSISFHKLRWEDSAYPTMPSIAEHSRDELWCIDFISRIEIGQGLLSECEAVHCCLIKGMYSFNNKDAKTVIQNHLVLLLYFILTSSSTPSKRKRYNLLHIHHRPSSRRCLFHNNGSKRCWSSPTVFGQK
jgi:hypothetical protein